MRMTRRQQTIALLVYLATVLVITTIIAMIIGCWSRRRGTINSKSSTV